MNGDTRTQQVSLGCGTLILIALIVLIFSGRGNDDLQREVHGLRSEVGELKQAIEAQADQLQQLREMLERPRAPLEAEVR